MEDEIFVDIEGYENKYQISNYGNVMSLNYNNTGKPKLLKPKINKLGYLEIKLSKNNKTKDFMIANLVAKHFVPTKKKCNKVINIDGNKLNNYYKNLKWVFETELRHIMYNRGHRNFKGTGKKLSYHKEGYKNIKELAEAYQVDYKTVLNRIYGKGWTLEETIKIKKGAIVGDHPNFYEYYGEILSSNEICRRNNISKKIFNQRINRGWNVYEAAEIKKGVKNDRN